MLIHLKLRTPNRPTLVHVIYIIYRPWNCIKIIQNIHILSKTYLCTYSKNISLQSLLMKHIAFTHLTNSTYDLFKS